MGAGALVLNAQHQILLLKPTYKDHWVLPGGVVELNESPRDGCMREVKEETGLAIALSQLLCIDYVQDGERETIQFVFYGGILSQQQIESIQLPPDEISQYQFIAFDAAMPLVSYKFQRRLSHCHKALLTSTTVYLEKGELVGW